MGFEPSTTEFRSDALTNWAIRPWVQLALRANLVQQLQFHLFVHCSRFTSVFAFVSHLICFKWSLAQVITLVAEWIDTYGIHHWRMYLYILCIYIHIYIIFYVLIYIYTCMYLYICIIYNIDIDIDLYIYIYIYFYIALFLYRSNFQRSKSCWHKKLFNFSGKSQKPWIDNKWTMALKLYNYKVHLSYLILLWI